MNAIESKNTNPYENLALEEALFCNHTGGDLLFLWQNAPCVILGRNQDAAQEVNLPLARKLGVPVVRRNTGGGAVYHDLGNLNFTYITRDSCEGDTPYAAFLQPLMELLWALEIPVEFNGRNDLCVDGRKISGSAARVRDGWLLHHGTLLVSSELARMDELLTPPEAKLRRNGVASVKSRVANLREFCLGLTVSALRQQIFAKFQAQMILPSQTVCAQAARLAEEKYSRSEWNFSGKL